MEKVRRRSAVWAVFLALALFWPATLRAGTIDSKHYRINGDLDPASAREYGRRLDAMYEEYARRLADFETPPDQKFAVHLFKDKPEYLKFTGNRIPNSSGIFIPAQRALAGYERGQGRAGLMQTLQHEAFHQFAWEVIAQNLPIWLDEGLAQVFEEGVWTGDQFQIGQVPPQRIDELKDDIRAGRFIPFRQILMMSRQEFQDRMKDPVAGRAQYNQVWAMTHFLVFANGDDGKPRYRARFLEWLRDLHAGRDAQSSFENNFSSNYEGFESRFKEWVGAIQPSTMAIYSDRMSRLAELVRLLDQKGKQFDSIDKLRDYLSKGRFHLTEERNGQKVTREENALVYLNDTADKPWPSDQLYLDQRKGPLPDIVLRPPQSSQIRVRFYKTGGQIDHELVFENR